MPPELLDWKRFQDALEETRRICSREDAIHKFSFNMTDEEVRAIAEETKRKHDEKTKPYREMIAEIEKRVEKDIPDLGNEGLHVVDQIGTFLEIDMEGCIDCKKPLIEAINNMPTAVPRSVYGKVTWTY